MFLFFLCLFPCCVFASVVSDANVLKDELFACVGFDDCQCSVDFKEFSCRTAGFLDVPASLPSAIVKL